MRARARELLTVLPFIVFFLIQLVHHQFWRDELNAWGIAAASPNLKVLYGYIRYEGHPALWYLILWAFSRFTSNPDALKVVAGLIGVAIYLFLALRSPFSRLEKILLYAGYFISFEYTVLARMYGICLLLTLVYAYRRTNMQQRLLGNVAILALLANADTLGAGISMVLLIEYVWHLYRRRIPIPGSRILAAAAVYIAALAVSFACFLPSKNVSWRTTGHTFEFAFNVHHLAAVLRLYIVGMWWPIARDFPHHFWIANPYSYPLFCIPLVLAAYWMLFRRQPPLLVMLALALIGVVAFGHVIHFGFVRHAGFAFLVFLVALWIKRVQTRSVPAIAILLLAVSAGAGVLAAAGQWLRPFSNSGAAAQWLQSHGYQNAALVGTADTSVAAVAEEMRRPIYFLDCNCSDSFLLFSKRRDNFDPKEVPERLATAAKNLHSRDLIAVISYALPQQEITEAQSLSLRVTELTALTGAEVGDEDYFIYRVQAL